MIRPVFFASPYSPIKRPYALTTSVNHHCLNGGRPSFLPSLPILLLKPPSLPSLRFRTNSSDSSSSVSTMDKDSSASTETEIAHDLSPIMKVYKNGRVERLAGTDVVPPGLDPETNVESKDVVISEEGVSARIFIPKIENPNQRLPLLVYFHGGGFCIETPFSPNYHNYLNSIVSGANVIGVSVHYRRAPEHPVPVAHEDSWTAVKWVASHFDGKGPDEWLNRHADLEKVFFAGDSAGANLAHHMAIRVGSEGLSGVKLEGIALLHPYFWGVEPIGSEANRPEDRAKADNFWRFSCPGTSGSDDPLINPDKDPKVGSISCKRVLVCVAEKDLLKDRGWNYKELLEKKSGWNGAVEVMEAKEEDHVFHMLKPTCENALVMLNRVVSFLKHH